MELAVILVFVLGYAAITLEHQLKVDKLVPAIIMMAICWALVTVGLDGFSNWFDSHNNTLMDITALASEAKHHLLEGTLLHHLGKTAEILIFLIGAMTIVEITDHFDGFAAIKGFVKTNSKKTLLWIMAILAFFLSAIIDNLTATIVLITILKKILDDPKDRLWFAGMIVVAANAGGAWSPIGDVTTTMLWIGKRVTAEALFVNLLLPSAVCMVIPVFIASLLPAFKGDFKAPEGNIVGGKHSVKMLCLGLGGIIFVPIFKTLTHLPPYVGMMLSLGIIAIVAEIITAREFSFSEMEDDSHPHSPVHTALSRIEMPSLLFFLGILMSVAALESLGQLFMLAQSVQNAIPNLDIVVMLIGAGSAVVDNVPLVAASMGMFQEPENHPLWHFIAFSAGTGGSMLIIGSAAGVVAMGMEKISFFWYFKNIAWLALIGFVAGSMTFLGMKSADLIITNEEEAVVEQVEELENSILLTAL